MLSFSRAPLSFSRAPLSFRAPLHSPIHVHVHSPIHTPIHVHSRLHSTSSPPLWHRIKQELKHYSNGTKLLGYEIKISTKLLVKFVQGYELTRRENNQLKRTTTDVFRLVPFSAFLIIPFAELLLPVALKIFPNLLPSTYESGTQRQQKNLKLIEIRSNTSKFLHETLEQSNLLTLNKLDSRESKRKFVAFFTKIHNAKRIPSKITLFQPHEIITIARMFKNDTILDNLTRRQLTAMSKFMSITPFGNDNMLRYQIRYKLKNIIVDDKVIDYEGIHSLTQDELYAACVSRGMKAFGGVTDAQMRDNLTAWLQLRLRDKIPSVLMVLSSTFTFGKKNMHDLNSNLRIDTANHRKTSSLVNLYYEGVLQVLSSIPDPVYNLAKLDVTEAKAETAAAAATEAEAAKIQPPESEANPFHDSKTTTMPAIPNNNTEIQEIAMDEQSEPQQETTPSKDDNEFKLNVLKEQEELIAKEQRDEEERNVKKKHSNDGFARKEEQENDNPPTNTPRDNITLDEDESNAKPIPASNTAKNPLAKRDENQ